MDEFEEALRNIDIFCRTLVKKMVEDDNEVENKITVEPIEGLLKRKYVIEEHSESSPMSKNFIPLPHMEEPLIDVFEDDDYVKVLMQCHCKEEKVTLNQDPKGVEICKRECHAGDDGVEVCAEKCQPLDLPVKRLQVENMVAKCNNNQVLEVDIPKTKTSETNSR